MMEEMKSHKSKKLMLYYAYDSECKKIFHEYDLEVLVQTSATKSITIGKEIPYAIPTDTTVEKEHIKITYFEEKKEYRIADVSYTFGSYYKIRPEEKTVIKMGQYVVIGETWLLWSYESENNYIYIIDKLFNQKKYKIQAENEYMIGRKSSCNIIIENDLTSSGIHLKFTAHKNNVEICDNRSTNGTFIKIDGEITKAENDFERLILRIGLETFCKIEYGIPKENNKNLEDFIPSKDITFYIPPRVTIKA